MQVRLCSFRTHYDNSLGLGFSIRSLVLYFMSRMKFPGLRMAGVRVDVALLQADSGYIAVNVMSTFSFQNDPNFYFTKGEMFLYL